MWVKSGFCATFWSSKWDVTWPLEAPAKEEAIEFIVTLDQTQQVRWVALRLLKLSAWIRFDDMREKLCTLLFWRNNHVFFVTWKNMYVFYIYIYHLSVVYPSYPPFFCQQKPTVFIHRTHSLLVLFGTLADTGRIGTDHPDTRLNWRIWCQKT